MPWATSAHQARQHLMRKYLQMPEWDHEPAPVVAAAEWTLRHKRGPAPGACTGAMSCCACCGCCPPRLKLNPPGDAALPAPNAPPPNAGAASPNTPPVLAKLNAGADWPSPDCVDPNIPPPAGLACPNSPEPNAPGLAPNPGDAAEPPNRLGELAAPKAGVDDAKLNAAELACPKPSALPVVAPPKPNGELPAAAPNAGALAACPNAGVELLKLNAGVLAGAPNVLPPNAELPGRRKIYLFR